MVWTIDASNRTCFYFSTLLIHFIMPTHPIHFIFHIQQTALRAIQGHSGYDQLVINKKVDMRYLMPLIFTIYITNILNVIMVS